jgi:hypothetical protein
MGSPLYGEFCRRLLDDRELLDLAARAPAGQPFVHMLFAAVHYLLLDDPSVPLAAYYASVTDRPRHDNDRAFIAFKNFCTERAGEIVATMRGRTVQLTFAGRAAFVLPAIAYVAREAGEPLSFIDIGCSAGLLTQFAHYSFDYGGGYHLGPSDGLTIDTFRFADGPPAFLSRVPEICRTVGIDLNPVDPADPREARWIDALCPPDMNAERRQLRAALALRARTGLSVIRGDALQAVPQLLATWSDPVCALAAHCLYQWPADARAALDLEFRKASEQRTLYFIRIDHPAALDPSRAWIRHGESDDVPIEHEAVLTVYSGGNTSTTLLGRYDSFGRQGIWLA